MSTLDEWENRRVRRRTRRSPYQASRPKPKEVQLAMRLMGGLTPGEKARGTPFDDPIPTLGDER